MLPLSALLIAIASLQATPGADFAARAAELQTRVEARLETAANFPAQRAPEFGPSNELYVGLAEFSAQAMRLSLDMEARQGPEDLRCIFRGMAQDALDHRRALATAEIAADNIGTYRDLLYLLGHAEGVGPIADQDEIEPFTGTDPGCPRGPLD